MPNEVLFRQDPTWNSIILLLFDDDDDDDEGRNVISTGRLQTPNEVPADCASAAHENEIEIFGSNRLNVAFS